jgi:putative ABC transport system ATP-binding protein
VRDNVLLAYRINQSLKLTADVRENAARLLANVGLAEIADRLPDQLSHGQRQRVAVCRALITSPQLILADEPTANLDDDNRRRVLDILDAHAQQAGATLVVVTHDREVRDRLDRTLDISSFAEMETGLSGGLAHDA